MVFATLLTLVLLPSRLGVLGDVRRLGGWVAARLGRAGSSRQRGQPP